MKWVLIVYYMLGPVDGALTDMSIKYFSTTLSSEQACYTALADAQAKIESLPDFRGASLECRPYDLSVRTL